MMIRGFGFQGVSFGVGAIGGFSFGMSAGAAIGDLAEIGFGFSLDEFLGSGDIGGFGGLSQLSIQISSLLPNIGPSPMGFGLGIGGAGFNPAAGIGALGGLGGFPAAGINLNIGIGAGAPMGALGFGAMSPFGLRNSQFANAGMINPMILMLLLGILIGLLAQRGAAQRQPFYPMGGLGFGTMPGINININISQLRNLPAARRRRLIIKLRKLLAALIRTNPNRRREIIRVRVMLSVLASNVVI